MLAILNQSKKLLCLFLAGAVLGGCAPGARLGAERWTQFHADGPSQGWLAIPSTAALPLVPKWSLDVGPTGYSSPVVGPDGTIYVGNFRGELVAVNANGTIKWARRPAEQPAIMSSPAVDADGNVHVISTQKIDGNFVSALHKLTAAGELLWSSALSSTGPTTGSPKVSGSTVFVHARYSSPNARHELFVFGQDGMAIRREPAQLCEGGVVGTGDVLVGLGWFWDNIVSCFPGCYTTPSVPLYEIYGWLDPTVAVVDFAGLEPRGQPLVIVADNCGLMAFRWDTENLSRVWAQETSVFDYSSPAVSGVLTVGRRDGRVVAHDYLTGARLWEYDADQAVMATPASLGRQVFVVSHGHLHTLDSSGVLIRKLALPDATYGLGPGPGASAASPAVTANLVYVSSTGGFLAATFDLSSYAVDTNASGGLSSPAVGQDGTLYMVTTSGSLRAYRGP